MKHSIILSVLGILLTGTALSVSCAAEEFATVDTSLFSVQLPEDVAEISIVKLPDNSVSFYESISYETYGGYVAGIYAYENLSDYAHDPSFRRGGILTSGDGKTYDIVIEHPTDISFDMDDEQASLQYMELSKAMDYIINSLTPAEGYTFTAQEDVDTTYIYEDMLAQFRKLIQDHADSQTLKENGFSCLYSYFYNQDTAPEELIGYVFMDINYDGYDELLIGSMDPNDTIIYDMYNYADGTASHLFSSAERDRFYLIEDTYAIKEEGSSGAADSSITFYYSYPNDKDLCEQISLIYSGTADPDHPYFRSFSFDPEPEQISENEWMQYLNNYGDELHPDFQPLCR